MDYFDISNQEQPTSGDILISNPLMGDPNFERSIIFLCEHSDQGSLGFVLNRPAKVTLKEVVEGFNGSTLPVYVGGPVEQNTLHFIYRTDEASPLQDPLESSNQIGEHIYMGGSFDRLQELFNLYTLEEDQIKFFIGYSGWSDGQLQKEIEENSWVVVKSPQVSNIFKNSNRIHWKDMMSQLGGRYKMMSNYPVDPRLN
ncbi:MAG: YqgE/AlgH family protein [Bacteroidota bacterium]